MAETTELKVVVSMVDQMSSKLKSVQDKVKGLGENAAKVGGAMTLMGGAITGVAIKSVTDFSELGDAIEKMATRTGLGAEAVSALRVAADASGTSIETVEASIKKMQLGMPELTENMSAFGVSLSDNFVNLDPAAQFEELAQKIGAIQDPAAQTQASIAAFGKAGSDLIPMFEDGSFSMDEWKKKAGEMGVLMGDETAGKAAELNDAMGFLTTTVNGLWTEVGTQLAPVFTDLANKLQPIINKVTDWMKQNPELTKMIVIGTAALGALLLILGPIIASLALLPAIIAGVTLAFSATMLPIYAVIAVIAALIAIGVLLWKNWDYIAAKAQEFAHAIAGYISGGVEAIRSTWNGFWDGVASTVNNAWNGIKSGIEGGINWVIDKINALLSKVNSATSAINRLPGVEIPQIGEIPALAKGGIVTKPTLALIGEAGPEAVVPLSRGGAGAGMSGLMGGMNKTTTINVYANGDNNADLISRLNLMAKML